MNSSDSDKIRSPLDNSSERLNSSGPEKEISGRDTDIETIQRELNDLQALYKKLLEEDRKKDEFLASLAHELRNFFAPQRNSHKILRIWKGQTEVFERALAIMERQDQKISRLLDDILQLTLIRQGRLALYRAPLNFRSVVTDALEASQTIIEDAGLQVITNLQNVPALVLGDSVRLSQVIYNLINNAAKFTPRSGIIEIHLAIEENNVVLRIKDNGIGIPHDELSHVFDLFVRVDAENSGNFSGLGIGLNLAKKIVESHGGNVEARNRKTASGAEFIVSLPLFKRHFADSEQQLESEPAEVKSAFNRVLIADDNAEFGESLKIMLELLGQEVYLVDCGCKAVEFAVSHRPDVIFMNICMPDIDGYQACRQIKELFNKERIFIVATTGMARFSDKEKSWSAGFDHHLAKPVNPDELIELLDAL